MEVTVDKGYLVITYDTCNEFSEEEVVTTVIKHLGKVVGENKLIRELATPEQILRLDELLD